MPHEIIFLSDLDVRAMIKMPAVIEAVEADFRRQADPENMIMGIPLAYSTDDRKLGFRWRLKTAVIRSLGVAGVRLTGYKIDSEGKGGGGDRNSTRYIVLSDPATSLPLAIIDEHTSFSMRTSAAICVAAKYLAIIGVGNVGQTALLGLSHLFNLKQIKVTSQRAASRQAFAKEKSAALGLSIQAVDTYEEACRGADIIIAATPSTEPFIQYEWIKDGAFVGVMGHEEVTPKLFEKCDRLFVDYNPKTEKHAPQIQHAIDLGGLSCDKPIGQIWEVVSGKLPGRSNSREKVVVVTVGLTTQDTAIAHALYLQAKDEGRGLRLPF
jgi:ornithine cyclodeaminase